MLVDRKLLPSELGGASRAIVLDLDGDVRDAMLRICDLSDVNPPRIRRRRLLAYAVPATLWAEAALLVAAYVPLGAS